MARSGSSRPPPPLDSKRLQELALRYVGKYATTRAKLRSYLSRKLRERGWNGEREPDLEALAERFAELGYVDDAAYALNKSRALSGRGYGKRRVVEKLKLAGVADDDSREALDDADAQAAAAALRYAKRRRLGPFALKAVNRVDREKGIASMVRAGHSYAISRMVIGLDPGTDIDPTNLCESSCADDA
jgi:regulatory protein